MIEFYNAVFIPSTKAFLLQLGNQHRCNLLPLPTLTMPGHAPAWPPGLQPLQPGHPAAARQGHHQQAASRLPAKCLCPPCGNQASR